MSAFADDMDQFIAKAVKIADRLEKVNLRISGSTKNVAQASKAESAPGVLGLLVSKRSQLLASMEAIETEVSHLEGYV